MSTIGFHGEYDDPTCMMCGNMSGVYEEVDTGMEDWELWCYCKDCDVETFHPNKKEDKK